MLPIFSHFNIRELNVKFDGLYNAHSGFDQPFKLLVVLVNLERNAFCPMILCRVELFEHLLFSGR